jgi:hypothetical protein
MYDFLNMLLRILDILHLLSLLTEIMFGSAIASLLFIENTQIMVAIAGSVCCNFWRRCCSSD